MTMISVGLAAIVLAASQPQALVETSDHQSKDILSGTTETFRPWATYGEIAAFYDKFDAADAERRADTAFALLLRPSGDVRAEDVSFQLETISSSGPTAMGTSRFRARATSPPTR